MRRVLLRASAKVAVSTLGAALVTIGGVLLFLPGPGILVLLAGVALLAREYRWARRVRDLLLEHVDHLRARARRHKVATQVVGGPPAVPADTPGPLGSGTKRDDVTAA